GLGMGGQGEPLVEPSVGVLEPVAQPRGRPPAEALMDQAVVGIAPAYPGRSRDVADADALARDRDHQARELVDRHHLVRADVDRAAERGATQTPLALHAFG